MAQKCKKCLPANISYMHYGTLILLALYHFRIQIAKFSTVLNQNRRNIMYMYLQIIVTLRYSVHVCHITMNYLLYLRDMLNVPGSGFVSNGDSRASGFVSFSVSPFQVINLLDGAAFPGFAAQQLQLYDLNGNILTDDSGNDLLYLPFIDFKCLINEIPEIENSTFTVEDPRCVVSYQY